MVAKEEIVNENLNDVANRLDLIKAVSDCLVLIVQVFWNWLRLLFFFVLGNNNIKYTKNKSISIISSNM